MSPPCATIPCSSTAMSAWGIDLPSRQQTRLRKRHARSAHLPLGLFQGAVEVDGAAGVHDDVDREAEPRRVECRIGHAVIRRQPGKDDFGEASLAEIAG